MIAHILQVAALAAACSALRPTPHQRRDNNGSTIDIDWDNVLIESRTTATLQSVANPQLLANSSTRVNALNSLRTVSNNYVRYVPWFPYPELAVVELEPPVKNGTHCSTSWNFTYADQLLLDFLHSTPNVSHIINFSTTPDWMWVSDVPYTYPHDVDAIDWNYNNGTKLRDPSGKEVADYYRRLLSWYVKGGFMDECGVYHHSGHHLDIEYWEVLNESEAEHEIDIGLYNTLYDVITEAIHEVSPSTQIVGLAMASRNATRVAGFLNPENHKPGTPLDWISYHFYSTPSNSTTQREAAQSFQMAEQLVGEVEAIEAVRKRISPRTKTTMDEIGTMDPMGSTTIYPGYTIPEEYWVWSGGVYAYVFSRMALLGIDVVGESQLSGYPGQYPSVSLIYWKTGLPTARLRVLQLIQHSLKPGDKLVKTGNDNAQLHVQGFVTPEGQQKVLLINKQDKNAVVQVPGFQKAKAETVDVSTGGGPWRTEEVDGSSVKVPPYAVVILSNL
ncbi:hypothetical protein N7474_010045 [Penicillium riverlandense]|uniref:uncharacterized protein n=1 Tax=Penicillium riverlandense TaxID=1903569 RepID=UPI002546884E|nr:uncharacterized protein N7474_010045 [Penicillium riverlandense]KAJ5808776.1 hypothetical protein N7474_010045 [Penicillium riverlandense]